MMRNKKLVKAMCYGTLALMLTFACLFHYVLHPADGYAYKDLIKPVLVDVPARDKSNAAAENSCDLKSTNKSNNLQNISSKNISSVHTKPDRKINIPVLNAASSSLQSPQISISKKASTTSHAIQPTNAKALSYTFENKKIIVGYYTSWSRYNGYTPDKINASKLTNINYAFADLGSDCKIKLSDSANDIKSFTVLSDLKKSNPNLKTLISIGGWTYLKYFSDAASTAANRDIFAQSCLDFILTYGFNGVDLDWEYPVSGGLAGNIYRTADKQNFTYLLQAIRDKFNGQSTKDGKNYLISVAAGSGSSYFKKN